MEPKEQLFLDVTFSHRAGRDKNELPTTIQNQLAPLVKEVGILGPYRTNWKNYGPRNS